MTTTFKALVIFTALAIYTIVATLPVSAAPLGTVSGRNVTKTEVTVEVAPQIEAPAPINIESTVKGSKVNIHNQPKPGRSAKNECSNVTPDIDINTYFIADGQDAASNYSDYLSDLQWWHNQNPGACSVAPTPMP
jgi:hypothetical protein